MRTIDYDLPIFEDSDIADLNQYSTDMAEALKVQIDKFGNPLTYKGEVATYGDLPSNPVKGDIYSVADENKNYVWNGTEWLVYSSTLDISGKEITGITSNVGNITKLKCIKQDNIVTLSVQLSVTSAISLNGSILSNVPAAFVNHTPILIYETGSIKNIIASLNGTNIQVREAVSSGKDLRISATYIAS